MQEQLSPILSWFYHWEKEKAHDVFLRQPIGKTWREISWAEAGREARTIAAALKDMGIQPGDHIGIYSKNCCHWIMADLAIMMVGAVSVPYYSSLPNDQLEQVLLLSDLKVLFVGKLDEWGDKSAVVPSGVAVIRFPDYAGFAHISDGRSWEDIIANYTPVSENYLPSLDDLWTIKFTSGTTGTPKGVMHIHRTPALLMHNEVETSWIGISKVKPLRFFSFLPLNHVGERLGLEIPCLYLGGTISFAESLDTFVDNIRQSRPTLFFAVPRIWTKFYSGVMAKMSQRKLDRLLALPIAGYFVKKKILRALGLDDVQIAATGAAITPEYIKRWYKKLGIHLVEAYGMTEVCGSMTNSPMKDAPADSVGKVIPYGEVKIDQETGEMLMKSPYVMTGYYKDEQKTREVLIDGWVHSGDRGEIDVKGFVKVVGRVKDAFKTSKGSYVIPNPIEERLSKNELIEQCCVAGLGLPQPVGIVNLSEYARNMDKNSIEKSLWSEVEDMNKSLANYQRISTVIVDTEMWTEENGFLTPTLKVKRGIIDRRYGPYYISWHEAKDKVIWR